MKRFSLEFDDDGPSSLSYEVDRAAHFSSALDQGAPVLYVNRVAARVLATVFAKLALGSHQPGFHVHLEVDFDSESAEALRVILTKDS
jgi:hypothetical protein